MATQLERKRPYALAAGGGEVMSWFSSRLILKASAPEFGAVEAMVNPGDEPPLHIHSREDEWFYLLDGDVIFHVGGENYRTTAGGFVFFPRGIAHTYTVESPSARLLVLNTPGGFEQMFKRDPKTFEEAMQALNDYGMEVVGPHPRDAAAGA
jgi:quercetin dioxygenase-like cupin family protein